MLQYKLNININYDCIAIAVAMKRKIFKNVQTSNSNMYYKSKAIAMKQAGSIKKQQNFRWELKNARKFNKRFNITRLQQMTRRWKQTIRAYLCTWMQ